MKKNDKMNCSSESISQNSSKLLGDSTEKKNSFSPISNKVAPKPEISINPKQSTNNYDLDNPTNEIYTLNKLSERKSFHENKEDSSNKINFKNVENIEYDDLTIKKQYLKDNTYTDSGMKLKFNKKFQQIF